MASSLPSTSASSSRASHRSPRGAPNPFFVTSSAAYGLDVAAAVLDKQRRQQEEGKARKAAQSAAADSASPPMRTFAGPSFPFLYRRTSAEIGKGVPGAATPATASSSATTTIDPPTAAAAPAAPKTDRGAAYLQGYKHQPKAEHPLYTTSTNTIGARPPNRATVTTERHPISQAFTNSFNNQRYSDQSLNCGITRSNVHKALDQFF